MDRSTFNNRISYIVLVVLFIVSIIFNDFIGIAGIHPDILLIFLIFLAFNEKPVVALAAAFAFGFLQDIFLPGSIQYWGLSPLFKTLVIYGLLKLLPLFERLRGPAFFSALFAMILLYFFVYDLLYYSGYVKPFIVIYRYALPESLYTFLLLMVIHLIFPLKSNKKNLP
jgi:rod shape-determining protein MreD